MLLSGGAIAQPSPSPAQPPAVAAPALPALGSASPEARAAAEAVVDASGAARNVGRILMLLRDNMVTQIARSSGKPADQVGKIVDEVLLPAMRKHTGELTGIMIEIYAATFTVDELHQLAGFYHSPLGEKLVERTPQLGQMSILAGQAWGQRVAREAITENAEELRRRGVTL